MTITISFIDFFINMYNNGFLPLLFQIFLIPNLIKKIV